MRVEAPRAAPARPEISDLVEAESKFGLDVADERRELEALREIIEASESQGA